MDVREIRAALTQDDTVLFDNSRNQTRRVLICLFNELLGMAKWEVKDDKFLDFVDIKIASWFDRAERFNTTKQLLADPKPIEKEIVQDDPKPFGAKGTNGSLPQVDLADKEQSEASKLVENLKLSLNEEIEEKASPWNKS